MLDRLPVIERLEVARVTAVPDWHPEHDRFEPFPVHCWVIRHPEGVLLVDSGIGAGHALIDEWYRPDVVPLAEALGSLDVGVDDVAACIVSHLHFDHCGQLGALACPVYVQVSEHQMLDDPHYTVAAWAAVPPPRLRLTRGDEGILTGVRVIATPGHTPGHQSVVVEGGGARVVLGGQCAFRGHEVETGRPDAANLHDAGWREAATDSLRHIRSLAPAVVDLSHDPRRVSIG